MIENFTAERALHEHYVDRHARTYRAEVVDRDRLCLKLYHRLAVGRLVGTRTYGVTRGLVLCGNRAKSTCAAIKGKQRDCYKQAAVRNAAANHCCY